jgi:chemotaxis protein MotB
VARKKKHEGHANHERWLVSYADFITLLFAFFVVMFASSQTDKAKAQHISDAVTEALEKGGVTATVHEILGGTVDEKGKGNAQMKGPGGSQPKNEKTELQPLDRELIPKLAFLNKALETEIKDGKLEIKPEVRGLVISLQQAAFFPSGDDTIDPGTYEAVEKIAHIIGNGPNPVRLEGHTDAQPIHTARFPSNWELSSARGISMLHLLSDRYGIPHERLAVVGYADTVPKDTNDTAEGRARNRRVDIVILNQHIAPQQQSPVQTKAPAAPSASPAPAPQTPAAPAKKK